LVSCPQIHLHELTAPDINEYISRKLRETEYLIPITQDQEYELIGAVREKADGVFFRISLATASLIAGINNGDSFDKLQARLEELPSELNALYSNILSRIEPRYMIQAVRYFQLLLLKCTYHELDLLVLIPSLINLGIKEYPQVYTPEGQEDFKLLMSGCHRTYIHLQQRCGMLLHLELDDPYGATRERETNSQHNCIRCVNARRCVSNLSIERSTTSFEKHLQLRKLAPASYATHGTPYALVPRALYGEH
jgi:hypothetical protein